MNLTDIFSWVGPLDHKLKSVCIYLKCCRITSSASNFTKDTVGCPIETSLGDR